MLLLNLPSIFYITRHFSPGAHKGSVKGRSKEENMDKGKVTIDFKCWTLHSLNKHSLRISTRESKIKGSQIKYFVNSYICIR